MQRFADAIQNAADAMYMPWTVGLLLAVGGFMTVRFRFVQFRRFPEALRTMLATQQSEAGRASRRFRPS